VYPSPEVYRRKNQCKNKVPVVMSTEGTFLKVQEYPENSKEAIKIISAAGCLERDSNNFCVQSYLEDFTPLERETLINPSNKRIKQDLNWQAPIELLESASNEFQLDVLETHEEGKGYCYEAGEWTYTFDEEQLTKSNAYAKKECVEISPHIQNFALFEGQCFESLKVQFGPDFLRLKITDLEADYCCSRESL